MSKPAHLFVSDGDLFDTRANDWHKQKPLRARFNWHHAEISTAAEMKATLRAGPHAWPGGYPLYFITSDGGALSFETARKELRNILDSIQRKDSSGWRVVACDVNYEDGDLCDDYTGKRIQSAYAD